MTSNAVLFDPPSALVDGQVLGSCFACTHAITFEDDFARMRDRLYHLGCMLHAIRRVGEEAGGENALRDGIDALDGGQDSERSAVPSPAAAGRKAA